MTAIATYSDVFQLIGAASDVQTSQQAAVTALVTNAIAEVEAKLGRYISTTDFTNVLFQDGKDCSLEWDAKRSVGKLFLKGRYRDAYEITSITEDSVALTAVAAYNDGNDYILDSVKGIILRIGTPWSSNTAGIKISGKTGLGGANALADIKQAVVEIAAASSGLWKLNVETEGGSITTIRTTPTKLTMKRIEKYILRDV